MTGLFITGIAAAVAYFVRCSEKKEEQEQEGKSPKIKMIK
jgi:hypothetical protein